MDSLFKKGRTSQNQRYQWLNKRHLRVGVVVVGVGKVVPTPEQL